MREITDEMIKRKHKEFNDKVKSSLEGKKAPFSPAIQRLRQVSK